eukprot:CAMPEP_0204291458 /NCGR_PEP_ID=MMETSP0468-20130131/62585_1 /ASSEMBLY_ACC=CAM_ASM_000383 /TAXON_ID=2969 /ORGANISM="Oxyrrhis marina" /LENGTH=99 /DNA_ID=CAMNT_0051269757 /DNA_START=325 /DNA_END=620 /DNA_ORIENTATION=-
MLRTTCPGIVTRIGAGNRIEEDMYGCPGCTTTTRGADGDRDTIRLTSRGPGLVLRCTTRGDGDLTGDSCVTVVVVQAGTRVRHCCVGVRGGVRGGVSGP